ncbi:MAG: hypothetical protein Ct9H300mP14_08750 [Gammaproteobacteria bacterium]|nr:MAG: hypothetical protein Ct9H300mP14_08750 [Gammaproteobacteria bacterium]
MWSYAHYPIAGKRHREYAQLKNFRLFLQSLWLTPNLQRQTVKRMLAEGETEIPRPVSDHIPKRHEHLTQPTRRPKSFRLCQTGAHHEPATWLPKGAQLT